MIRVEQCQSEKRAKATVSKVTITSPTTGVARAVSARIGGKSRIEPSVSISSVAGGIGPTIFLSRAPMCAILLKYLVYGAVSSSTSSLFLPQKRQTKLASPLDVIDEEGGEWSQHAGE